MAVRKEWIEYLLIDIENEKDKNVQKFYPFFKTVINDCKEKRTTPEQAATYIKSVIPSVLEECNEKYRINLLLNALVSYTLKIT